MPSIPLGMMVEGSVAFLLVVTIIYCMILNRRLKRLHNDRDSLRKMVQDLVQATDLANAAVKELKVTAREADTTLNGRLEEAERFGIELANQVSSGTALLDKLTKLAAAARAAPTEPLGSTEKVQSALQQLAMRPRMRGNAA
jgi:hypothetical protein